MNDEKNLIEDKRVFSKISFKSRVELLIFLCKCTKVDIFKQLEK